MRLVAGAAAVDITPPVGVPMAGFASRTKGAEGVDDPLFVKALVLEDTKGSRVGIVTSDLIGVPKWLSEKVRHRAEREADIPPEGLLLCASHTHFGPSLVDYPASTGAAPEEYLRSLVDKFTGAVLEAASKLTEVEVRFGRAELSGLTYNRRPLRPDGKVKMVFQPPIPEGLQPGPIDPEVLCLFLDRPKGRGPIATLVNFSCHPVCGTDRLYFLSADYPGVAMAEVERRRGGICLFSLAPAGNVNPVERGAEGRRKLGAALAEKVLEAEREARPVEGEELRGLFKPVKLPLKRFEVPEGVPEDDLIARRVRQLRELFGEEKEVETEVQVLLVGDTAIVGLPGEVFCEFGLGIKRESPFRGTMVASLANHWEVSYVPTRRAYEEGGYEPSWSPLAPGAGEVLFEAALDLLREATSD